MSSSLQQDVPSVQAALPPIDQIESSDTPIGEPVPQPDPAPDPPATTSPPVVDDGFAIDDLPIASVPSPIDPSVFEPAAPCGSVDSVGSLYATTMNVDALGDGTADDTATVFWDDRWVLRLDVSNGPSSQLEFSDDDDRWHALDGVARIGDMQAEQIIVNEKAVGDAYSFAHLVGVDDTGCLQLTSSQLQGLTGKLIHSLECDATGGHVTRVSFPIAGVSGSYELSRSELRADGSAEGLGKILVPGTHPVVVKAGANNC